MLLLGVVGAALFYGDAIITPAISVLSAVEGLKTAPGLAHVMTPSVEIAISLIAADRPVHGPVARHGQGGAWFGPICLVWFMAIAALGVLHLGDEPRIFLALSPTYGLIFWPTTALSDCSCWDRCP